VVLDLDDFKQINDRHGHETGDRVLEAVGRYLAGQRDLVASRFGGEEFVLLLPERDPWPSRRAASRSARDRNAGAEGGPGDGQPGVGAQRP
jgi:diguanylate cyclase (GGDEF)-like protein